MHEWISLWNCFIAWQAVGLLEPATAMCGIAGIIGRIAEPNRLALKRMNGAMAHRGPNGEGYWESEVDARGCGALLAHRRLSILDLSNAAAQPMIDPATGDVVVLNGEIYNYVELRKELAATGQSFQSSGDTAVMLRMLSLQGQQAAGVLRGMFAFAFWNVRTRRLMLGRDPLGIKPLYIARNPDPAGEWSVVFASEVRAILASGLLGGARLHPNAAASVVWNGFMVSPDTAIRGVESMLPGELRVFDSGGREAQRTTYAPLPERDGDGSMSEAELGLALQDCVRLHLASDVPLAVFLSGGIDSSAVANLAQKVSPDPVHTFTLAFEEVDHNEGDHARRVAAAIGSQHHELVLSEQSFLTGLDSALNSLDQPTFDGLNSYFMSKAVREAGFTVALAGSGGDELFGGYTSFRNLPTLASAVSRTRWMPRRLQCFASHLFASLMQQPTQGYPPQTRWSKLPEMVRHGDDLLALYQIAYSLFLPQTQRDLLGGASQTSLVHGLPEAMQDRLLAETRARSPLSAISIMEQRIFLGERLLRDTDAASMAASVEVRLPLVDHMLLTQVDGLSQDLRYKPIQSKTMLRRIGLQGLDPTLFARPKSGFVLPINRWLHGRLGRAIDSVMRDPVAVSSAGLNPQAVGRLWRAFQDGAQGLYWSRVWAIYVFVRWCQQHKVSA